MRPKDRLFRNFPVEEGSVVVRSRVVDDEPRLCVETLMFLCDVSAEIELLAFNAETQRLLIAHEGRLMWEAREYKRCCQRPERGF